jgi:SAM-dependent methyltransferase
MKRELKSELLDELPANDPRAMRSRRDLRRVNALMGHARIAARALGGAFTQRHPQSIVDLGAGDGTLLLRLARMIAPGWKPMRLTLVDRQRLVTSQIVAEFAALSWQVECVESDAFDWLARPNPQSFDITIASLFLHHFLENDLRKLLSRAALQTEFFVACEPERVNFSLLAASLLGLIGCNDVTRYDGKVSVRAGFVKNELSALWPEGEAWRLSEQRAGLFTHLFAAQRIGDSA